FRFVRTLAAKKYSEAVEQLELEPKWTPPKLEEAMAAFYASRSAIRVDPAARAPDRMRVTTSEDAWRVEQVLLDPEEHDDAALIFSVNLEKSRSERRAVLALSGVET